MEVYTKKNMVPKEGYNNPLIETSFGLNGQAWNIPKSMFTIFLLKLLGWMVWTVTTFKKDKYLTVRMIWKGLFVTMSCKESSSSR